MLKPLRDRVRDAPCLRPKCKGRGEVKKYDAGDYGSGWEYRIECDSCGLSTWPHESADDAMIDWLDREER